MKWNNDEWGFLKSLKYWKYLNWTKGYYRGLIISEEWFKIYISLIFYFNYWLIQKIWICKIHLHWKDH